MNGSLRYRLVLAVWLLAIVSAALAVDDPDPRSQATARAGNAQFGLLGDAPLLENPAGIVQTEKSGLSGGVVGRYADRKSPDNLARAAWSVEGSLKTIYRAWDFVPAADGYMGRLHLAAQLDVSYAGDTVTDDSDVTRQRTVEHVQSYRIRPAVAYGIIDQLAVGVAADIAGRLEDVEYEGNADYELEREHAVIVSPAAGLLVTPVPAFQFGARFDFGFESSKRRVSYDYGDRTVRETYRTVFPRTVGGGLAALLPTSQHTAFALDVDYTFRTERDGEDLVLPAINVQLGVEKELAPYVLRGGVSMFSEQEDHGCREFAAAFGVGLPQGGFRWNLGADVAYQEQEVRQIVDYTTEEGWRFGLQIGGALF